MTGRRHRWLAAGLVTVVLASLLVVAGAGAGQLWRVAADLREAAALAGALQGQLGQGQIGRAQRTLTALQARTGAARQAATGPGWRVGTRTSALGPDLAAVAAVTVALDDLARTGLPPLVATAGQFTSDQFGPRDGRFELAVARRAGRLVAVAHQQVRLAGERVAAIPTGRLTPPVRSAVIDLRDELARLGERTAVAARVAALAPVILGSDGPRRYLVLFQNPAELRATGGMPGAFAVIEADAGAVRLTHQASTAAYLRTFDRPVLPLDPALRALHTDRPGIYPANVNLTPHFPTAAGLAREMYRRRSGRSVDGVVATDPVALSYLLKATGRVRLPGGGTLTAGSAVRVLLSEAYAVAGPEPDSHHEFFAGAVTAVFDALLAGAGDPRAAVAALVRAAAERRMLLWSAHPREQRLIAGTPLAGELPADDGDRPAVGVFLNDGSGAKLGYYLTQAATLTAGDCRADGRRELRLVVRLGSRVPAGLPPQVLGLGLGGDDPRTIRTQVLLYSPTGGALADVALDGGSTMVGSGTDRGRAVGVVMVDVAPGAGRELTATVLTRPLPAGHRVEPELWLTPAVTPWQQNTSSEVVCPVHG